MKFLILIEKGAKNYSAYVPDLPGCVAAAKTKEETVALMKEAMEDHIKIMKESSETIPTAHTESAILEIAI